MYINIPIFLYMVCLHTHQSFSLYQYFFQNSIHLEFCLTEIPQVSDKYQNVCALEVWAP